MKSCIKKWGNLYEKEVWQINQGEQRDVESESMLRFFVCLSLSTTIL